MFTIPKWVFTMPESVFTMTETSVHDDPKQPFTMERNGCSRWAETSIRKRHRDLVLLFLCNGYRLDLEAEYGNSVLDEALNERDFEIVELLLKWGADPTDVSAESVIDTYKTELIDRFWRAGVDYTADPGFVTYLVQTVNKPLYGWLRRNRSHQRLQGALDVALLEAVTEERGVPAHLLQCEDAIAD